MIARLALLALLLLAGAAKAAPDPEPAALDLTGARILASPGWPGALKPFLPPGREVEPLALPLPAGPVLVLGLLDKDPVARAVGESLLGWKPGEDLRGGYVVEARREGDRSLAVILGADAAALAAARFELETFTPTGKETEPRSVEFQKPDEQGGVRIAPGCRSLRPKYRIRAAAGLGPGETLLDVAAAHANRLWVTPEISDRDLALLRDHGVEPVAWSSKARTWLQFDGKEDPLAEVLPGFKDLQRRGVRCFALDCRRPPNRALVPHHEGIVAERLVQALRPDGLKEVLVLPVEISDEDRKRSGLLQPVGGCPEVLLGWTGPTHQPLEIRRAHAENVRREAGVPVVLVETWMEAAGGEHPRIPSFPRGRAADLGDVLDGVVVLAGPGSAAALAAAWAPPEPDTFAELGELLGVCVQNAKDGSTFLLESAACLEQTLLGRYADPPWLRGLPQRLRESAAYLPATLLCRWTSSPLAVDGRLSEPAWTSAPAWEMDAHPEGHRVEMRALSDGRTLVLGLRFPKALDLSAGLKLSAEGHAPLSASVPPIDARPPSPQVLVRESADGATREFEVAYDHYALRGDPYPSRRFAFDAMFSWRFGDKGGIGLGAFAGLPLDDLAQGPGPDDPPRGALLVVR